MSEQGQVTQTPAPPVPETAQPPSPPVEEEKIHWLQKLMDNTWLLLILGVLIPTLSYTVWGLIDLLMIPPATIP